MLHFKISASAYVFLCLAASVTVLITTTRAATDESYVTYNCPKTSTYSPNSTYQTNLDELLSWLSSNSTRKNGYYNTTVGINNPGNTVYGAFLCRGDLTPNSCQDCVSIAAKRVLQYCPSEKDSVIWFAECMIRYSSQSFFTVTSEVPVQALYNTASVTDIRRFTQLLGETMNTVVARAANGGGDKKFATKEENFSSFQTLYTLAQCTPDLSESSCEKCLKVAIGNLPSCCNGKQGGRVLIPSCNIRYELYPFYHQLPVTVPTPDQEPRPNTKAVQFSTVEYLQFDFDAIIAATYNFSDDNKLEEGGFGEVYKGTLPNGQDIAVKRLSRSSSQGTDEFKNEVVVVTKLQHRNLVRLLGFCLDGEEKMLIYEFVPNKSLDHFLFDPEKQQHLNWPRRYKIIEGIAQGLFYLHEDSQLRIIHYDLKASNILLDEDLNPKISNFGMGRIVGVDQTQGNTDRIVGRLGYMPPEYSMHGDFSVKMDVYSFGILVLEIISGKKITSLDASGDAGDLLNYAWENWRDGKPLELLDMTLRDSYSRGEVNRCIHIGLSCVQKDPALRPAMQTIIQMLRSHSITFATPERPAAYIHSTTQESFPIKELKNSDKSTSQSVSASVDEASITLVYPR